MGLDNTVPDGHLPVSCELVERHESEAVSSDELWQRLRSIDSDSAAHIHPNDRRKIKRCLSPQLAWFQYLNVHIRILLSDDNGIDMF